jgi:hypothetical protein
MLFSEILTKNIDLTEIYGSTESAGVGYRKSWQDPFSLFPYWKMKEQNGILALEDKDTQLLHPLMDHITANSDQTFFVNGRKDQQIKIAGHLVDLEKIRSVILTLTNIHACTISAKAEGNEVMLQADLQLIEDNEDLRSTIKLDIRKLFLPHERPRMIYFSVDE